jgi:uncharacterized protein YcfJ
MRNVQQIPMLVAALLAPALAAAGATYDQARVIDVQPEYGTMVSTVPREVCQEQRVQTGAGGGQSPVPPLVGAALGGVAGNAVSNKNQPVGAAIGAVLGGAIGYDIARRNARPQYVTYGTQEVCTVVQDTHEEQRLTGYRVRYEYLGQRYSAVTPNPPGATVRVRVDVSPAF